jgi:hypothetical protein
MKLTEVSLSRYELENFKTRFFLLVDRSGDGCWNWLGARHSSGAGRYLWSSRDGGNDRYVGAHRVAYYLLTGELPVYLRNLCGNRLCCRPLHWWAKPTGRWKPKPRRATRGLLRQLPAADIEHIRLLASLSHNEDEIGTQFGLTRRQVAGIAMGRLRPDVGGRIRPSRFRGIRHYHDEFERELRSMRPDEPVVSQPQVVAQPEVVPEPIKRSTGCPVPFGRPFPAVSYSRLQGRRLPRTGRC